MPDATGVVQQIDVEMRGEAGRSGHLAPGIDRDPPQKLARLGAIGASKAAVKCPGCD